MATPSGSPPTPQASLSPQPAWLRSTWLRVVAVLMGILVAAYVLLVPASILLLLFGSQQCLGPGCGLASLMANVGGAAGVVAGVVTVIVLILLAVMCRKGLLITALAGLAILPLALLSQFWGHQLLDEGGAGYDDAIQLSYQVDWAMQGVLVEVSGAGSEIQPGILGPDLGVDACELPDGGDGYRAWSQLTFTSESQVGTDDRQTMEARFDTSRERMFLIPASIALTQDWRATGPNWTWTVTTSCQPLPGTEATTQ